MTDAELTDRFLHHPPTTPEVADGHTATRAAFVAMALALNATVPEGRDKALCFTKLEEALYHANAGIARVQRVDGR